MKNIQNKKAELTFFVWSDTHFGYKYSFGANDCRGRTLQQMNQLPGWPYPAEIGGCVATPAFILHCGDFVDHGDMPGDVALAYYLHCLNQTRMKSFETLGNHELPFQCALDYFVKKHGDKYYSFDQDGVHFVSLYTDFDPKTEKVFAIDGEELKWLKQDLEKAGSDKPVVLFSHSRLDQLPNASDLDGVIANYNVILMLAGHHHAGGRLTWNGKTGVVIGHCRDHPSDAIYGRKFLVVRITNKDVAVVPWRWDLQEWAHCQGWQEEEAEHFILPISKNKKT